MTRQVCFFSGRVQGVGFRYTAKALAAGFAVTGYVMNLRDGRVMLVAEGRDDQLSGLHSAIRERMAGHIDQVQVIDSVATQEFSGFSIRH